MIASDARAEELVQITEARFSPNKLGSPTNASGSASIRSTTGPVPPAITHVTIYGPAGVTLNLEGTGTCNQAKLEAERDPRVCPANSRAGFGGGEGVYELAKEVVPEKFTLDLFLTDNRPGHVAVVFFLNGATPVSIQEVFTGVMVRGPKPYGLGLSINVPLIKPLPDAGYASATSSFITLGSNHVAYFKKVHGRRKLQHVKGIILPNSCPRGGFPVSSQFTFLDGSTVNATRKIACPRGGRHARR
jgi:hypothetical protein